MAKSEIFEIKSSSDFKKEVEDQSKLPVLVDFHAPWCAPCQAMEPVLKEVHQKLKDKLNFAKVNIDESPDIANKFQILSVPTILVFSKGQVKGTIIGANTTKDLIDKIENLI